MNPEICQLTVDGVASAKKYPHLARALNSCAGRGELLRLLPGVYTAPDNDSAQMRMAAVAAYGSDLVLTGRTAATLHGLPLPQDDEHDPETIDIASPRHLKLGEGFRYEQRYINSALISYRRGLPTTSPALTVLDLLPSFGPVIVDDALRIGATTLPQLQRALALSPRRRGNAYRRDVLADSRDAPWSPLERDAHRRLRDAGITGWVTNHRVEADGIVAYIDIALEDLLLGLEIDGEDHHSTSFAFHNDRRRDQALARSGWQILHFSSRHMQNFTDTVENLIATRRRALGRHGVRRLRDGAAQT